MDNIYIKSLLHTKITVDFKNVDNNIYNKLQKILKKKYEGICLDEGFIKPDSINILSYSCGELNANYVTYDVVYECLIANAVEGMKLSCIVKTITKIGIRAELNDIISPFIIFIARDHSYNNNLFSKINENDIINVKVIGQRYELNNKFISVIAELIDKNDINEISKKTIKSKK